MSPIIILFTFYGTHFENDPNNPIPRWLFAIQGIFLFFYRILDECDGK
jgi:hypothetical protein